MYDVIILGAGPGGVSAAQEAIKNNLSVLLIDENRLGGTCLNRGCIPTKFFIKNFNKNVDVASVLAAKDKLINSISTALEKQLIKDGVEVLKAKASFKNANTVIAGDKDYQAKKIIIATGSSARSLDLNGVQSISPEALLSSDFLAESYLVIGGGVIGIEYALLLRQLDKNVTVIEKEDRILAGFDKDIVKKVEQLLKRNKVKLFCGDTSEPINYSEFDAVVVAVGRIPNSSNLNLANAEIDNINGWIAQDEFLRTNQENIYACGDIAGKNLFAYTAEHEGKYIISHILGENKKYDPGPVAKCIYGQISVAAVGLIEEELIDSEVKYNKVIKNFIAYPAAHVYDDKQGMIKVLYDDDDYVLGAHIVSKYAAELIGYFSLAIKQKITVSELAEMLYLHPSVAEIISKIWE